LLEHKEAKMYYVGIDGGGTNTRACILDEKMEILGIGKSGPSSIDTVDIQTTIRHIKQAIDSVFEKNKVLNPKIASIFIGLGGVLTEDSKKRVSDHIRMLEAIAQDSVIAVENDVYNALLGGNETRPGICLIAGTGSVAFGVDELGNAHRAGGYGYQEGDLGSSYDLGKKTLQYIARVFDKRKSESDFSKAVLDHLKIETVEGLLNILLSYHENRTLTASLAPFVTQYADLGNKEACLICDEATSELALCVASVYQNIELTNKELAIIGSLGNTIGYFNQQLVKKINQIGDFNIHGPLIEPVIGSAYKAYQNVKK